MFNPQQLIRDLDAVFIQFPDLAEDEELRTYVIEHGTDFKAALQACLHEMEEAGVMGVGLRNFIDSLEDRFERFRRRQNAMRALMQKIMEHAGMNKFVLPQATLSLRQNGAAVIITDENSLPDEYVRIKKEPNKSLIKSALLEHKEVPGATLSNGGVSLSVRTK